MIILQSIISALLLKGVLWAYKKYELQVNIHNLPIIIFGIMAIMGGVYLSCNHIMTYMIMGTMFSIFIWILHALTEEDDKAKLLSRFVISLISGLVWHQVIVFMVFFYLNYDKLNDE